jgi:DNA-binding CsgD family transcriptional regulator
VIGEQRMPKTGPHRAAEAPSPEESDSLAMSRRGLRDLAALLALPAMWVDHDPGYIAAGLLGVLFGMLRLDVGYVRFDDPAGGPALERWRPEGSYAPVALESMVTAASSRARGVMTVSIAMPSSDDVIRVTSMSPTLPREHGLVLVGSRRDDFPTDSDLHLLRVAVSQAAISIHTARRLAGERTARIAAETALRSRNAFLATLAHDLTAPLATLSEWAGQANAFATETILARVVMGSSMDAPLTPTVGYGLSPLTPPAHLSRREAEVLGLLAQGLSNKEIAGILWLSERTIERHITSLYRKIGVERRSEATAFALRHSLVDADTNEG